MEKLPDTLDSQELHCSHLHPIHILPSCNYPTLYKIHFQSNMAYLHGSLDSQEQHSHLRPIHILPCWLAGYNFHFQPNQVHIPYNLGNFLKKHNRLRPIHILRYHIHLYHNVHFQSNLDCLPYRLEN